MLHCRFIVISAVTALAFIVTGCQQPENSKHMPDTRFIAEENLGVAIFAGGCFWCTESDFDKLPGVVATTSGYIGGTVANPTYKQVVAGKTGHVEAVKIQFDKTATSFSELLNTYWLTIDPTFEDGQFCDIGPQYRSVIFYLNPEQQTLAEASKEALAVSARFDQPVVTEILPATEFYMAEDYHQDYYIKNPLRYAYYRNNCGRDERLEQLWGVNH
ncbi:peptide-methionine (S)-S-oxide reductase MsrA [Nitrosomonas aestuarii]|uniref:peptide-methionine (S)-S-oxide reductase MsrA n=1 Tax=Nitrosomonas aestuarii TaxID=52441 RepID=UPI000D32378E|nr:peptide-methionine (S)-S-oxide reductase MsrA [Nitrosomonas aestuarii]PTN11897.1 peptide-methionine (S)-S-oxide reductase [Nitrosomonas aestuarii]